MNALRFLIHLTLVIWVGGIIFFIAGEAPAVLRMAPSHVVGGAIISSSLLTLHWIGIGCGIAFVIFSMIHARATQLKARPFAAANSLIYLMLFLTAVSQRIVLPRMAALRPLLPQTNFLTADFSDPRYLLFQRMAELHRWSVGLETGVLVLGLIVIYLEHFKIDVTQTRKLSS